MIYDPLFVFLKNTGITPLVLSVGYGFSFIIAMTIMLYISGGQKSVKEYFKDPLGIFIWPFFVLAPLVSGYLKTGFLNIEVHNRFIALGLNYKDYSLRLDQLKYVFWVILLLSCAEGIESLLRYHRTRPTLWLSKPKFLQPTSTILFNIPLGIMALVLMVRLIDQWVTFHNFMTSGWLPNSVYNSDEMYGLRWLYNIIVLQMIIATFASFGSLLILVREGKQKYSWIYKVFFLIGILATSTALLILSNDMNLFFNNIHSNFLELYFLHLNQITAFASAMTPESTLQRLLLTQEISIISQLPKNMPIPNWLSGIIGIRLIIFIPEIYTALAKSFGWKKFSLNENVKKILELIK